MAIRQADKIKAEAKLTYKNVETFTEDQLAYALLEKHSPVESNKEFDKLLIASVPGVPTVISREEAEELEERSFPSQPRLSINQTKMNAPSCMHSSRSYSSRKSPFLVDLPEALTPMSRCLKDLERMISNSIKEHSN